MFLTQVFLRNKVIKRLFIVLRKKGQAGALSDTPLRSHLPKLSLRAQSTALLSLMHGTQRSTHSHLKNVIAGNAADRQ